MTQSHDQSTVILLQFSMITKEIKNFTNKVSSDITKITQAYHAAQENTGKSQKMQHHKHLQKHKTSLPHQEISK